MILYSKTITKTVPQGFFSKTTKRIKQIFEIEYSESLGYRATMRRIGSPGGAQISPKWRKTRRSAENDLKKWIEK